MRAETRIPVAVHCEMQSIVMFSELLAVSSLHWLITDSTKLPNSPHDIHLQLMYLWIVFAIVLLVLFYYAGTCWLCHVRLRSQWPANRGNSFELLIPLCFRSWSVFFPVLCNNLMCLVLESVAVSGALLTVTLGSSFVRHRRCLDVVTTVVSSSALMMVTRGRLDLVHFQCVIGLMISCACSIATCF